MCWIASTELLVPLLLQIFVFCSRMTFRSGCNLVKLSLSLSGWVTRESDHSLTRYGAAACARLLPVTDERPNFSAEKALDGQVILRWFCPGDSCEKHQHSVTIFCGLCSGTVWAVVPVGDVGKAGALLWATWLHRAWGGGGYTLVLGL